MDFGILSPVDVLVVCKCSSVLLYNIVMSYLIVVMIVR